MKLILKGIIAPSLILALTACGGDLQSNSSSQDAIGNKTSFPVTIDEGVSEKVKQLIDEVAAEEVATEQAYTDLASQEKKIRNINILSTILSLPFKATTEQAVNEKLKNPIKEILSKILQVVDKAYDLDNSIREKLEQITAELDESIPSHAKALEKIQELHSKLDSFEEKVDEAVVRLQAANESIIDKIDRKMKMDLITLNPRALLLKVLKGYFDDLKKDLAARLLDEV